MHLEPFYIWCAPRYAVVCTASRAPWQEGLNASFSNKKIHVLARVCLYTIVYALVLFAMQKVAVVVGAVLLWASSITARRSAATQAVVERCTLLGEAPIQENNVYIYDDLYHVTKNPFLWVRWRH